MVVRTTTDKAKPPRLHDFKRERPLITLLTDFGRDEAVYLIKSAIRKVNTRADIEDITHAVPAFNILSGAWRLARAVTAQTEAEGTIYVAVVDPGVGGERNIIIVRTKTGKYLIGPDNGLLSLAFQKEGIDTVVAIENTELTLLALADSVTFDGKDVFGPAAAHLAAGVDIREFGSTVPEDKLKNIALGASCNNNVRAGFLVDIDNFGSLRTNLPNGFAEGDKGKTGNIEITIGGRTLRRSIKIAVAFEGSEGNALLAVLSSTGCIDVAINTLHAARELGIGFDSVDLNQNLEPTTRVKLVI